MVDQKRVHRLYGEAGPAVRNRRKRERRPLQVPPGSHTK